MTQTSLRINSTKQPLLDLDYLFRRKNNRSSLRPEDTPSLPAQNADGVAIEKQSKSPKQDDVGNAIDIQRREQEALPFLLKAKAAFENKNYQEYLQNLVNAAEWKEPKALLALGKHLFNGEFGLKVDPVKAEGYLLEAIENGCGEEGQELLAELHYRYPKYFGSGKLISAFLHRLVFIFGSLLAAFIIILFFFAIPILLIVARGNLWFWQVPMLATVIPGAIWLLISCSLLIFRFKKILRSYSKNGVKAFEGIVSNTFGIGSFLLALCFGEYHLLSFLAAKTEYSILHPTMTNVLKIIIMIGSGGFVFYGGFALTGAITAFVEEKVNEYY